MVISFRNCKTTSFFFRNLLIYRRIFNSPIMVSTISPRESGNYIAKQAKHVKILEPGIKELSQTIAKRLKDGALSVSGFSQCEVHPSKADENAIQWIFVVDTLNFCFWSKGENKWQVTWKGKSFTGYFALCAAINRALDEGYPITDPNYYSRVTISDLKTIFRGDDDRNCIPLIEEREKCLHQVGLVLLDKFQGSFANCIKACNNSAEKLLKIIVENFECFRDEGVYNNVNVSFYKRAQILIGDIWVCFRGKDYGFFRDIDKLTMFADYRVPQVLIHFKAMEYSDYLMDLLKKDEILKYGSEEEIEIRGCSIHVVELVAEEIKKILPNVKGFIDEGNSNDSIICNSILIDHFLWDYRREHAVQLSSIPFHKTFSINPRRSQIHSRATQSNKTRETLQLLASISVSQFKTITISSNGKFKSLREGKVIPKRFKPGKTLVLRVETEETLSGLRYLNVRDMGEAANISVTTTA